jgi:hypothetical protein
MTSLLASTNFLFPTISYTHTTSTRYHVGMPRNDTQNAKNGRKWPTCRSHLTGALLSNSVLHCYYLYYFRLVDVKTSWKDDANQLPFVTKVAQNGLSEAPKKHQICHFGPFRTLWTGISISILFSMYDNRVVTYLIYSHRDEEPIGILEFRILARKGSVAHFGSQKSGIRCISACAGPISVITSARNVIWGIRNLLN